MLPGSTVQPIWMNHNPNEKVNRELFVGNTPPGTSEVLLLQFLNGAMQRTNLVSKDYLPILQCRVNTKFAFIECATNEDANKALNLTGIPFMGMCLRVSRPSKYAGPHIPNVKTWQQLTGTSLPPGVTPIPENSQNGMTGAGVYLTPEEKVNRELFVGNTTPEMTEQSLREFLGQAMIQVGLNTAPGNPINACRLSGKFAFVELRSEEETAAALNLNNIPFLGTALRVGRPSKYTGPQTSHGNWEDILAKYMSGELTLPSEGGAGVISSSEAKKEETATKIVELKNMVSEDDLKDDAEYDDILQDTKNECSQFGQLKEVIIPKLGEVGATKIFLVYLTKEDAEKAIKSLQGRTFDGHKVEAKYFSEERFQKGDYGG